MSPRKHGNNHHILHYEDYHRANRDNAKLRLSAGLIVVGMDYYAHNELHAECPGVPPLSPHLAQRAEHLYRPTLDPLDGIDNYCWAVEEAAEHPRTHEIERGIAYLAISAVRLQIPFIKTSALRSAA